MMSTAILMAMGAEQSSKQPVAHDVEQLEGSTFAQALDARMEATPASLEKAPSIATQTDLSNANTEVVKKSVANVSELAIGTKAKVLPGQTTPPTSGSKGVNTGKTVPIGTAAVSGLRGQAKTEDMEMQGAALLVDEDKDAVQAETASKAASAANTHNEDVMPQEDLEDKNQIQMVSIQTPGTQKEIAVTGSKEEAAPVKKTAAKTQEGGTRQVVAAPKNDTAATVHPIADEIKPEQGIVVQVSVPMTGQVIAAVAPVVPTATSNIVKVENDKSGAASGYASVTSASFAGRSTIVGSGSSTSSVHAAKTSVADVKTEPVAPGDQVAATKSDAKAERVQQVAANADSDSDIKARTVSEPVAVVVHTQVPGADIATAATTPFAAGLAKSPGEGGAHATGSPNFLNEQDGSGGVARSMEPMPRTLWATPSALEVGIPDGTHGWLKVRAEMADGGVVNASVSAASLASQEMLHRELPSLTAYLQSEKVAVNTVVVHSTTGVGAESRGNPAGSESGGAGQTPQKSNEGGGQRQNSADAAADEVVGYEGVQGVGEDGALPLASLSGGGSWLSVRA
jgi:hypothetical protein